MKINHLGIAVRDIKSSSKMYEESLGWNKVSKPVHDPKQGVHIIFMADKHGNRYELLAPAGENSPLNRFLKQRISLYHICYEVDDIKLKINELTKKGFFLISGPVSAVAFGGRSIAFLINTDNLIIELVELELIK